LNRATDDASRGPGRPHHVSARGQHNVGARSGVFAWLHHAIRVVGGAYLVFESMARVCCCNAG
jgi:hypothetical protein